MSVPRAGRLFPGKDDGLVDPHAPGCPCARCAPWPEVDGGCNARHPGGVFACGRPPGHGAFDPRERHHVAYLDRQPYERWR